MQSATTAASLEFRTRTRLALLLIFLLAQSHVPSAHAAPKSRKVPSELDTESRAEKILCANYGPKRTQPVFKDAFSVGFVLVDFPDTRMPELAEVKQGLFKFGPMSITEYFREYSQGKSWPEPLITGEESFPKCVYRAPHPLGYYCEYDFWSNPLGYQDIEEGHTRADALRAAAEKHAFSMYKRPPSTAGITLNSSGRPHLVCYAYATKLVSPPEFEKLIRPEYKGLKKSYDKTQEAWDLYRPAIGWSDPLWPNSIPQVVVGNGGGTVCHELGHVLGAPDYYHAPEKFDGIPGTPCLNWAYGPTGPGYCRYIYNAFLTKENYPTITKSGTCTLSPRNTNPAGSLAVGCFVPSAHPHYLLCIEYVKGEEEPLGNPGKQGLLVHVINTTLNSSLLGSPDICYTYRPGDPWFRGEGDLGSALLGKATGRLSFSTATDPGSRLPNLMESGVMIDGIQESETNVSFNLTLTPQPPTEAKYKYSMIPKIRLDGVTNVLPTSMHAKSTVLFRGEPVKSDYGFCWNTSPHPQVPTGSAAAGSGGYFPLYHRDRYSARILGLKPMTKYYVRAYARNAVGVSYSEEELTITTPSATQEVKTVPPLLDDDFTANWCIEKYFGGTLTSNGFPVGSCAVTTLLKLTAYYRDSLIPEKPKREQPIDCRRIHMRPSESRPPGRMKEFTAALFECAHLAKSTGMQQDTFGKDFEKTFTKAFELKPSSAAKLKPVENLTETTLHKLEPFIRDSLLHANPVVVGQYPPPSFGLTWLIIDGYDDQKQYHLVYPSGKDRDSDRKTGWYPLDTVLKETTEARVVFGLGKVIKGQ